MTEPAALPRGEYTALAAAIGARSTPETIDAPVITIELKTTGGAHRGCTFGIEIDLGQPGGLSKLREVARATGIEIADGSTLDMVRGPVARVAAWATVEGILDGIRGRSARFTVWRFSDDVATVWRALPVEQETFNPGIEKPGRRPASDFSRITGHHLAKIVASELEEEIGCTKLILSIVLFKNHKRLDVIRLSFSIIHQNASFERRNRRLVQAFASAVCVDQFEYTEDLYDRVFKFTVWNDIEFHFTCQRASEAEKSEFEVAVRNRWLWPSRRDFERNGGGGDAA